MRTLVAAHADLNATNPRGYTALGLAEAYGRQETIAVLRQAGAAEAPAGSPGPAATPTLVPAR